MQSRNKGGRTVSVILNFRNAFILVLSYCLSTVFAASLKTNTVYNNGTAVITLPAIASINEIRLTTCSSIDSTQTGSKTCVKSQFWQNLAPKIDASDNKKITIANAGVSLLQIFGERRQWQSPAWPNPLEYEQLVFVRESPTSEISDLANKYNPMLSFHSEEKYFPIALSSIFNIPISNWSETNIEFNEPSSTSAGEILSKYASPSNYAFLDKNSAKSLTGAKNSFPAYFLHELNDDKLWISYIYFFGYDEKTANSPANHQLDRESIIIQFARVNNQWSPEGVVYAGHLPEQPTEFLGSEKTGAALTRWDGGKSFVRWADVSKGSNGNPLVYVARGSHALFPALGWFNVINVGVIPNLKEPAGGSHEGSSGELSYLDMSQNIGLTFSGSIVDGLGSGAKNSRFPPFIRMPLQNFAASAGTNFSDCVANKQGCEKYINQAIAPAITDLTFTASTANTTAKLTAVFSTDMQSGYSTTGAYVLKAGKEGYWPDKRTFVVEFDSYTSGGQITLVASGFKSVSGQPLAADRVYTFNSSSNTGAESNVIGPSTAGLISLKSATIDQDGDAYDKVEWINNIFSAENKTIFVTYENPSLYTNGHAFNFINGAFYEGVGNWANSNTTWISMKYTAPLNGTSVWAVAIDQSDRTKWAYVKLR
jgi:hypothetical protein